MKINALPEQVEIEHNTVLTLFRMEEGAEGPPTSFSPVTSTNVGIIPKNFLDFQFQPFCHACVKFEDHT